MKMPVIVRLKLENGDYHDVNVVVEAQEFLNGESITVTLPAGTFEKEEVVCGFQIIKAPGEIIAAKTLLFSSLCLNPSIAWSITCKTTIACE